MIKHYTAVLGLLISSSASLAVEEYNFDPALATQQQGAFTFDGTNYQQLNYLQQGGFKVFGGDMLLHPSQEITAVQSRGIGIQDGVGVKSTSYRWKDGVIPYQFLENRADYPGLSVDFSVYSSANLIQLRKTMAKVSKDYTDKTSLRLVERTTVNASQYPAFVLIGKAGGCFSSLGDVTSPPSRPYQTMGLADGCYNDFNVSTVVHEFGHAFGLFHEQSRSDRDSFVTINTANISAGKEHNFDKITSFGADLGAYNYASIMHYGTHAFSKNGSPTITPIGGQPIGRRSGNLNNADAVALNSLYATDLSITSQVSPNLQANANFDWLIGLEHKESTLANRSASDIKVVAQLPAAGYQLVSQSTGWSCVLAGDKATCTRTDNLASKASTQLSLTLKAAGVSVSNQTFTATVSSASHDPVNGNNSDTSQSNIKLTVNAPTIDEAKLSPAANDLVSVSLSWKAALNAATYNVERTQISGSAYTLLKSDITELQYIDSTALPEKIYFYRLTAKSSDDQKSSGDKQVSTPKLIGKITSVEASLQGLGINLKWTAASNASSYTISRSSNGGAYKIISVQAAGTLSYTDSSTQNNTRYKYKVSTGNSISSSEQESGEVNTTVPAVTAAPASEGGGGGATGSGLLLLLGMLHIYRRKLI